MFDPRDESGAGPAALVISRDAAVAPTGRPAGAAPNPPRAVDLWRLSDALRTPLNAILGGVELVLDGSVGALSAEARACLADVQAAGRRLMRDVQDLLALAEIGEAAERGAQPADLVALLREVHGRGGPAATLPALEIVPADARLVIRGTPEGLARLAATLVDLAPTDGRAGTLSLHLERRVDGCRLAMIWPGFDGARLGSIQLALIVALTELHGGSAAILGDLGLCLDWPAGRLE